MSASAETIRIIPDQEESYAGGAWIAAPPSELEAVRSDRFVNSLQDVLGMEDTPDVTGLPLTYVSEDEVIDPLSIRSKPLAFGSEESSEGVTKLGGYVGVKIEPGNLGVIDHDTAREIGALLARELDDSKERVLVNYTDTDTSEVRLTGEGYNLATEITDEHEVVDLDEALAEAHRHHRSQLGKTALHAFLDRFHMPRPAH